MLPPMLTSYKPSGRYSNAYLTLLPAAAALGAVLGAVYQAGIHYIGFVKINLVLWVLAGLAAGGIAGAATRLTKCRNPLIAGLTGAIIGLAAAGSGHVLEYWLQTNQVGVPVSVQEYVEARVKFGWTISSRHSTSTITSSSGPDISGMGVWAVWGIEALGLVLISAFCAAALVRKPFCEACQTWVSKPLGVFVVPWVSEAGLARAKSATTLEELLAISPEPPDPPLPMPQNKPTAKNPAPPKGTKCHRLAYTLMACPQCEDMAVLTVTSRTSHQVHAKRAVDSSSTIRSNLVIDRAGRAKVLAAIAAWSGTFTH